MNKLLTSHRVQEYITITMVLALVWFFGVLSTIIENDLLIILSTAAVIIAALLFMGDIEPTHLLYALCLGVSFLPYINLQVFPLSGVYVVALLFIVFSSISIIRSDRTVKISPQAKWLSVFLVLGVLLIAVAPDKKAVIIYGGQFFLYICIYVAAVAILNSKDKIIRALRYIIYGSVITIIISGIQLLFSFFSINRVVDIFFKTILGELFIGSNGIERIGESAALILNRGSNVAESSNLVLFRVFGPFEGPTIFGVYLLIIALLVGGLLVVQRKKRRIGLPLYTNALLFLVVICCLILTWTRSALLAFLVAFTFILIYQNKKTVRIFTPRIVRYTAISIATISLIFTFLWLFEIPIPGQSISRFSVQRLGGSAVARLLTILFAVNYIIQNPIIGIGMGNYKYVQPGVGADATGASFATAHNTYLELGVELGLPGLILFVLILRSFIKQAAVLTEASLGSFYHTLGIVFMAIWIGYILVSFFGGNLIHPRFMTLLLILAGIQTASYYLYIDDKKKEDTVYRLKVTD